MCKRNTNYEQFHLLWDGDWIFLFSSPPPPKKKQTNKTNTKSLPFILSEKKHKHTHIHTEIGLTKRKRTKQKSLEKHLVFLLVLLNSITHRHFYPLLQIVQFDYCRFFLLINKKEISEKQKKKQVYDIKKNEPNQTKSMQFIKLSIDLHCILFFCYYI